MVNQHSNFHVFRTQSYNTSTWPIHKSLLEDKKDIISKHPSAMLPLENFLFNEITNVQNKCLYNDLLGWTRFVLKIEFQNTLSDS